jgi:hypothetical protein
MANISAYLSKAYLDWCLLGATPTRPGALWAGLAAGVPTSVAGSELGTQTGYSRITALFGAAASPAGSASNTAAMTFGPFSSAGSVLGLQLWDGSPVGSSDMLWYGTLQTARTIGIGDTLVVAAGALIVTLS